MTAVDLSQDPLTLWTVIICLGLGSFLLRFSFLGLVGKRELSPAVLRHLRYTAVGIIPGLVAPMIMFPDASGGSTDPARLAAALVTLAIGAIWRNVVVAIAAGAATLYGLQYLLG